VEFKSAVPISKAELCYTRDFGKWQDRTWESIPAEMDASQTRAQAKIPDKATAYYLNLYDQRDCAISSEHEEAAP